MLNVVRSICVGQNVRSKNLRGILSTEIGNIIRINKYNITTKLTGASEKPNPKNEGTFDKGSRKNLSSPKITLLSTDSTPSVVSLEEAQKLSKRRNLKLVKVVDFDRKTSRPVYKLMTGAEYFQEDLNRRKEKTQRKNAEVKDPKLLTLTHKISDHDLGSKIKNIIKWLNRRHEVRIVINAGENDEAAELICKKIETETKGFGKLVQKRKKDDDLKFQLVTLKKKSDDLDEKTSPESDSATTTARET